MSVSSFTAKENISPVLIDSENVDFQWSEGENFEKQATFASTLSAISVLCQNSTWIAQ